MIEEFLKDDSIQIRSINWDKLFCIRSDLCCMGLDGDRITSSDREEGDGSMKNGIDMLHIFEG